MTTSDDDLHARACKVLGLINNGPFLGPRPIDVAEEQEVRRELAALLLKAEGLAKRLCEVRAG